MLLGPPSISSKEGKDIGTKSKTDEPLRLPLNEEYEDTFESNGEDEYSHINSDPEDVDFSLIRSSRLRLSFRGSKKFSRRHSVSTVGSPSPVIPEQIESLTSLSSNEEVDSLKRLLSQRNELVMRYEEELLNESNLVKSLEEKLDVLENTKNELYHELDNSKINIKNLEAHMMFLDEKLVTDQNEIECQRNRLNMEKEKMNNDRKRLRDQELDLEKKLEAFESWKTEILSQNHILQSEVMELNTDNKKLLEALEVLTKSSTEEINKLTLENLALKQTKAGLIKEIEYQQESRSNIRSRSWNSDKRNKGFSRILITILLRSGLLCVHEFLIYLRYMLER